MRTSSKWAFIAIVTFFLSSSAFAAEKKKIFDCEFINYDGAKVLYILPYAVRCGGVTGFVSGENVLRDGKGDAVIDRKSNPPKISFTSESIEISDKQMTLFPPCTNKEASKNECRVIQTYTPKAVEPVPFGNLKKATITIPGCGQTKISLWAYPQKIGEEFSTRFCAITGEQPPKFADCNDFQSTRVRDENINSISFKQENTELWTRYWKETMQMLSIDIPKSLNCSTTKVNLCLGAMKISRAETIPGSKSIKYVHIGNLPYICPAVSASACPIEKTCGDDQLTSLSAFLFDATAGKYVEQPEADQAVPVEGAF